MGGPWEELTETREHPPPMSETSMVGPLEVIPEVRECSHQCKKCQSRAPWEAVPEVRECSPSKQKMLMVGPMAVGAGGPGALTINTKNNDGEPPERQFQMSESVHHQC
jgi:hypothetical protein